MNPGLNFKARFSIRACRTHASHIRISGSPKTREGRTKGAQMARKKIDPLNRKQYSAVSAALTVANIPAAVSFYQKAFGFSKRGIMNGPDGKPVHAELTLRGATLMLGPESEQMGRRSAKSVGASPASLY